MNSVKPVGVCGNARHLFDKHVRQPPILSGLYAEKAYTLPFSNVR